MKVMMREIFENFADREWRKKQEILTHAKEMGVDLNERELRNRIAEFNLNYLKSELYIAHSSKGYKLTTDRDEIKASATDLKKRALNMLKKYYSTKKELTNKTNLTLFDQQEDNDVYELIKTLEEN